MSPKSKTVNSAFINHLGLVRGMFAGEGSLLVTAFSLNQVAFRESAPITLVEAPDKYSETLSNFKKQLIQVEFAVDEIDEYFGFGDVIVFIRPVESSYPG